MPPSPFPPWMTDLMQLVMPSCGLTDPEKWPDSCNLNYYADGGHSVGWHADNEDLFMGKHIDVRIISLSLGATRRFELRPIWPTDAERKTIFAVDLVDGAICCMEGMTQKHFHHRIPEQKDQHAPRINLTWRWILEHTSECSSITPRD